jgi:hypothetical protein
MVQIDAQDGSDGKWDGWENDAIVSLFRESESSHNNLVVFSHVLLPSCWRSFGITEVAKHNIIEDI